VNDGKVSVGDGPAIAIEGANSTVTLSGGRVLASKGDVICANGAGAKVTVNGGMVEAYNGSAIAVNSTNSSVTVSGGQVLADEKAAIVIAGAGAASGSTVTVNGGFVFALSTANTGGFNAINMANGGAPVIGGTSVVCTWDRQPSGTPAYPGSTESSADLTVSPASASAIWANVYFQSDVVPGGIVAQSGIYYVNGANNGFHRLGISGGFTVLTVEYNPNDGGSEDTQMLYVKSGDKAIKPTDPTRTGYNFAGWYKDSGLTTAYDFNATVTNSFKLYAKWTGPSPSSMSNFASTRIYVPGMFSDVNENAWYGFNEQKVIARAYEYNLMSGSSATTFNPSGNITIAEAITVATRVHSFYTTGLQIEFTPVPGDPWYQGNVNYAIDNGMIKEADFSNYNVAASRAQMAYIFSRTLPQAEFAPQNTVNSLPDVQEGLDPATGQPLTPYRSDIIMLYEAGILAGNDAQGRFNPNNSIIRAEAAAIISRVILPATRFSGNTFG
jgi:uncharacterized repeat protein (TIGR02543 family)